MKSLQIISTVITAQKMMFSLRVSSVNVTKSAADLVIFTEEILNGKLHFYAVYAPQLFQNMVG